MSWRCGEGEAEVKRVGFACVAETDLRLATLSLLVLPLPGKKFDLTKPELAVATPLLMEEFGSSDEDGSASGDGSDEDIWW